MPLTKVSQITYGYPFNSKLFSSKATNKKALVRIRDVLKGYTKTYTSEICDKSYLIHKGDLLVGMDGEFNISEWKSAPAYLNQRVCRIEPIGIDRLYLKYFLQIQLKKIEYRTAFVTVKHLSAKALNNIIVPVPSAEYQRKISSILNIIDNSIFLQLRRLNVLNDLVKSQFVSMFGNFAINDKNWYTAPLSLLGSFKNGLNFSLDKTGNQIKCLGVGDFQNNDIISYTDMSDIDLNTIPDNSYLLQDDDIVLVRSNGNKHLVGRCVCVKTDSKLATFSGFCIRFRKLTNQVDTIYLIYALKNSYIKSKIIGQGANVQNINQKTLRDVCVPIPPLKLQLEYAELIKSINKSKFVVQQSIEKLELLKKSLMQQYFG